MSDSPGNFTAQQLDDMFGGAGDATSAFIMQGIFGCTMNAAIISGMVLVVVQALAAAYILCMAHTYYTAKCEKDPLWIKFLVGFMLTVLITGLVTSNMELHYIYGVRNNIKNHLMHELVLLHITLALVHYATIPTHIFFGYKAYCLWNRNILILIITGALVIANFTISTITDVRGVGAFPKLDYPNILNDPTAIPQLIAYGQSLHNLIEGVVFVILAGELAITGLLLVGLFRTRTGWKETDSIIKRIMILLTESMVPPFACHIVMVTTTFVPTGLESANKVISAMMPPVHTWTVLFTLLARDKMRKAIERSVLRTQGNQGATDVVRSRLGTVIQPITSMTGNKTHSSEDDKDNLGYHVLMAMPSNDKESPQTQSSGVIVQTETFMDDGQSFHDNSLKSMKEPRFLA